MADSNRTKRRALLAAATLAVLLGTALAKTEVEILDIEADFMSLKPMKGEDHGHEYWYQVPDAPRGVTLLLHGCVSSGYNWWPQSDACKECRGLPEHISHSIQALKRGYAVIAVSSKDRTNGCWSWYQDSDSVAALVRQWMGEWGLSGLPLYIAGISSGASFGLKLPRLLKVAGVLSEALGIDENTWGLDEVSGDYPPTVFASMLRDEDTVPKIEANRKTLKNMGVPVEVVDVTSRNVYPTYFTQRFPSEVSEELSRKIAQGLFQIQMIDKDGVVQEDPRYTPRPWMVELQDAVPEMWGTNGDSQTRSTPKFPEGPGDVLTRGVLSLMNLAFADHEIISDYTTAAYMWFESGGKADFQELLEGWTYGWPPTEPYAYGVDGIQDATAAAQKPPNPLVTRPGTLPGCALEHVVHEGDYCFQISDGFGISVETLQVMNPAMNCSTIQPGDLVCLQLGNPNMGQLEKTAETAPANATAAAPAAPKPAAPKPAAPKPAAPKPAAAAPKPAPTTAAATTNGAPAGDTSSSQDSSSSGGGVNAGAVAGAVVGAMAATALVVAGVWWFVVRKKHQRQLGGAAVAPQGDEEDDAKMDPFTSGKHGALAGVTVDAPGSDLSEVLEQSGSPSGSARRRHATPFNSGSDQGSGGNTPVRRSSRLGPGGSGAF